MSREGMNAGWVASVLSRPGTTFLVSGKTGRAGINVQTSDRSVVHDLRRETGAGKISGPYEGRSGGRAWMWQTRGQDDVAMILREVYHLLGGVVRERVDRMVQLCPNLPPLGRRKIMGVRVKIRPKGERDLEREFTLRAGRVKRIQGDGAGWGKGGPRVGWSLAALDSWVSAHGQALVDGRWRRSLGVTEEQTRRRANVDLSAPPEPEEPRGREKPKRRVRVRPRPEVERCDAYDAVPERCDPWDVRHRGLYCDGRSSGSETNRLVDSLMARPVCYEHPCDQRPDHGLRIRGGLGFPVCRRHLIMNLIALCGLLGGRQDEIVWPPNIKMPDEGSWEWVEVPEAIRRLKG